MNSIKQSNISFILVLALSLFISGCGGGPTAGLSLVGDDNNPGDNPSPPIVDLLSNPKPPAPVITTAEATTSSVFLKWIDTSSREYGFVIVRDGIKIGETDKNISQYTDTSVLPATTYVYLVVAWNKEGEGVSAERQVTTPSLPTPPKWILPEGAQIRSLAVDQTTGELYAAGQTYTALTDTPNAGATDAFLVKLNPDGALARIKQWGTAGYDFDWDMTIFEGNVFLLWNQNGIYGIGDGDEIVSQFDADGNIVKVIKIGDYAIYKIVVDSSTIYLDGLKMDREGMNWVWTTLPWVNYSVEGPAVYNGTAYYTGQSLASTDVGGAEGYTAAVDASNNVVWTSRWGKTSTTIGYGIAVHAANGVYTVGPGVALRHDFYGNILWTQQISVCMYSNVRVVVDDTGVYIINGCGLTKITNDGTLAWQTSVTGQSLALFNDVLFVADGSNVIYRYDALTGSALP